MWCLIRRCPPEFSCETLPRVWDCMHSRVSSRSASLSRGNCINCTLIFFSSFFFCTSGRWCTIATNQSLCGYFPHKHKRAPAHKGAVVITTCSNYSICSAADSLSAASWFVEPRNQLDDWTEETKDDTRPSAFLHIHWQLHKHKFESFDFFQTHITNKHRAHTLV